MLLGSIASAPVAEILSVEFPSRPKMVADVVALLTDGRILHVEFQLTNDARMLWRCFQYFGAIQEAWPNAEIIQVVIFLGNGPVTMKREIKRPSCDYWYHIIDMKKIPASHFLDSLSDTARVLALLCDSPDPQQTIRDVLASWRHLTDNTLLENIERLRILSRLRKRDIIANKEIKYMPLDIDMSESIWAIEGRQRGMEQGLERGLEQGLERGLERGLEQGLERGMEQGLERGIKQGKGQLLTRLLGQRFGPLPTSIQARIGQATEHQLEQWSLRIFDAQSLVEIFRD